MSSAAYTLPRRSAEALSWVAVSFLDTTSGLLQCRSANCFCFVLLSATALSNSTCGHRRRQRHRVRGMGAFGLPKDAPALRPTRQQSKGRPNPTVGCSQSAPDAYQVEPAQGGRPVPQPGVKTFGRLEGSAGQPGSQGGGGLVDSPTYEPEMIPMTR